MVGNDCFLQGTFAGVDIKKNIHSRIQLLYFEKILLWFCQSDDPSSIDD